MFCEPPMYGRLDAGQSSTIATHQPADDEHRDARERRAAERGAELRRAGEQVHERRTPGSTSERLQHLGEEPEADQRDRRARANACCPSSSARDHRVRAAPTSSSTSSASGLLNRNISAATGVSASTAPAMQPAAGREPAPHRRVEHADRGHALERLRARGCSTS